MENANGRNEEIMTEELNVEEAENKEAETAEQTDETVEAAAEEQAENKEPEVDYKEKFYYLAAEMENLKRRFSKEKSDLLNFGNEKILTDLVDVIDNFDRTVEALSADEDDKVKNIVVCDMISR